MNNKSLENNGRVNTLYDENYNIYDLFKKNNRPQLNFQNEATKGMHHKNDINSIFFSRENIDLLQEGIRYSVYTKSCEKYIVDRQSDDELKIIMRSIYFEHANPSPKNIYEEVRRLNTFVLDFSVPKIIQEIQMYLRYRSDINKLPMPLDRGEFVSSKGTKTLIQKEL
jgi:hypothetical protein